MLDTRGNPCQSDIITCSGRSPGAVVSMPETSPLISKWGGPRANAGGYRPGAGRKPKPIAPAVYDTLRWYVVRTDYGAEIAADMAMRQAGFETLFPLMWVPPAAARRTELGRAIPATSERLVPLLPCYLMVRFNVSNPSWRRIPTMRGVERLFSMTPERPTPIPDSDIAELTRDLAPNNCMYPPAAPERAIAAKRRWTDMATALLSLQMETV